ncbi:ATP-binding protein [Microbispora siamensis]
MLDNCEHVVEPAAALADRLLAECPGLRILATSREPLGITGERLWPVGPLGAGHAVRLFAERAAAVRPGYPVDGERDAVERICRELDGMPLAIELAAARLRTLSAGQIAERLGDRFRLFTGGSRTAMPRHQTLRAVVEWSWDLLDAGERALAARLAVFAGGATLEAAEQVCEGDIDVLGRLVDKSLVVFDGGRYRMLETIKAYAAERLAESGDERQVRLAHAEFFARLAEAAEPHLRSGEQLEWLARLSADHDNLSAALRWACEEAEGDLALRLVGGLGWYWWLSGHRLEGAQRSAEALTLAGDDADPARLALAHAVHGITSAGGEGNLGQAGRSLAVTVRYARDIPGAAQHPLMAIAVPIMSMFSGLQEEAEAQLEPLLGHPDGWVAASARIFRAHLYFNAGRSEEGEADLVLALGKFRMVGDRWGVGNCLSVLAETNAMRGDLRKAVPLMEEAIALLEEVGAVEETPFLRTRLAVTLSAAGDREAAEAALRETERLCGGTRPARQGAGPRGEVQRCSSHRARARRARGARRPRRRPRAGRRHHRRGGGRPRVRPRPGHRPPESGRRRAGRSRVHGVLPVPGARARHEPGRGAGLRVRQDLSPRPPAPRRAAFRCGCGRRGRRAGRRRRRCPRPTAARSSCPTRPARRSAVRGRRPPGG